MTVSTKPKLVQTSMQHYNVLVEGQKIGEVWLKTTRYNLNRVIVTRDWIARASDGKMIPDFSGYSTRRDAVAALIEYANLPDN